MSSVWPQTHVSPDDRFCYYCQKQYANLSTFAGHVTRKHGVGLAKSIGLINPDDTVNTLYPKKAGK